MSRRHGVLPDTGGLAIGANGALYGATVAGGSSGNGTVFSLTPPMAPGGTWTEVVLYSFAGGTDGAIAYAGLVIGSGPGGHAVLYATPYFGGTSICDGSGCGTVFSLTPPASPGATWTETLLYSFAGRQRWI